MLGADRADHLTAPRRTIWDDTTSALRARSPEMLRQSLLSLARRYDGRDDRDLMMSMAPFHHCARKLGLDPAVVFADVAAELPPKTAELVRSFGARRDVKPRKFAFALTKDDDGPRYKAKG